MEWDQWFSENEDWRPYADLVVYPPLQEEMMKEFPDISTEVLSRAGEMVQECGGLVSRGAIYIRVRREGEERGQRADTWATMLCLQSPPASKTTDSFWAGRKPWYEVYGERVANTVKAKLAKQGVNLKPGDEYMPELARYQGDPEAVVSFDGARSYIKNLCEKRGWAAEGAVSVNHREPDEDPYERAPRMGEDLIRQKAKQMVEQDSSLKRLPRRELREKVLERFGPSK